MRLICHKCTNYFLLHNFFLLFFTLSISYLSLIYPLSTPYLPLIYPLSTPYLPLIYPPRWRKLAACVQFKIQNSKLFSTEPSAKDKSLCGSHRAGAAEYVKPVRLALYTNFTCRRNWQNDQRLYFFC